MLSFIGQRRLIEKEEKKQQFMSGSLPGKLEQSGFPRSLVPLYTWPSLSLHQQNPDEG